jgi:hypothetical protein
LFSSSYPRSSSATAAVAFAVATAGSSNPPDHLVGTKLTEAEFREAAKRKCSISSNVATMRVLSVLRHWVTKHTQVSTASYYFPLFLSRCDVVGTSHLFNHCNF